MLSPFKHKINGVIPEEAGQTMKQKPSEDLSLLLFFRILIAKCTGGCYAACEFSSIHRSVGLRDSDYFRGEMKWKLGSRDYLGQSISLITLNAKNNLVQGFPYTVVLDSVYKSYKSPFLFSQS